MRDNVFYVLKAETNSFIKFVKYIYRSAFLIDFANPGNLRILTSSIPK